MGFRLSGARNEVQGLLSMLVYMWALRERKSLCTLLKLESSNHGRGGHRLSSHMIFAIKVNSLRMFELTIHLM
jgi:hypothetical protein